MYKLRDKINAYANRYKNMKEKYCSIHFPWKICKYILHVYVS